MPPKHTYGKAQTHKQIKCTESYSAIHTPEHQRLHMKWKCEIFIGFWSEAVIVLLNKWLLIPDECFTVGRLRLPGFRFKTTKKIKDIWGLLKKEVRSTVLKKWLKYTQILFPSVNCHRIVIANASTAVMASGVGESGFRIMEGHLCGEKGAWASVCGQEERSRCGRARLSAQPLTWNESRRDLDSAPLCSWSSESRQAGVGILVSLEFGACMLGCSQQMKRFLLCSFRLGNKSWLSLVLMCWVTVK